MDSYLWTDVGALVVRLSGLFSSGAVDKLKNYDLPYGIIIISIAGGHFYDR